MSEIEAIMPGDFISRGAVFSDCKTWRFVLWRIWDRNMYHRRVAFVGLNPSTADESVDDPTIRRCIGFAKRWGFGGMYMLNLFAYRSPDPSKLLEVEDPVGPDNDLNMRMYLRNSEMTVACWGIHGAIQGRGAEVAEVLRRRRKLYCLGMTKEGHPKHPLYLPKITDPMEYIRCMEDMS